MKLVWLPLTALTVSIALFASLSSATDATEALAALKKFQAGCKPGISYQQYSSSFHVVDREVKSFFSGTADQNNPLLSAYMLTALGDYAMAGRLWGSKAAGNSQDQYFSEGDSAWKLFLASYPEGKSLLDAKAKPARADVSKVVSYIWKEASKKISQADQLMSGAAPQQPPPPQKTKKK